MFFSRENFTRTKKHNKHKKQTSDLHLDAFYKHKMHKNQTRDFHSDVFYTHKKHKKHKNVKQATFFFLKTQISK